MHKTLEAISLATFVFQAWITGSALYGAHRLSEKIPIHFDMASHVDGWGSPATLLIFPAITVPFYLLFTLAKKRLLEATSYPVEVTDENRGRLEALYLDLLTWIKAEVVCLFAWIQWDVIAAARLQQLQLSAVALVGGPLVVLLTTVIWYNLAMRRAGRSSSRVS
jgi:hypothetical protein